jgi:hypothetical protein
VALPINAGVATVQCLHTYRETSKFSHAVLNCVSDGTKNLLPSQCVRRPSLTCAAICITVTLHIINAGEEHALPNPSAFLPVTPRCHRLFRSKSNPRNRWIPYTFVTLGPDEGGKLNPRSDWQSNCHGVNDFAR